ncbi:PCC domain-containing protein [Acidimangrovimonas sediminis]|uniref:PCC domain-containing protein n=1 Tax=Acidimangrovimonas sediminis TaxID=2056283 RepID=UPI000C7F8F6E|nr:DUF296 domain-containing protein [Acidimangrovimonas sediminis]
MPLNPEIRHPGPVSPDRDTRAPARVQPISFSIAPGQTVEEGLARGLRAAGCDSAYVEMSAAPLAPFAFVMPAPSPDDSHAAWYSPTIAHPAATVLRAGAIVGWREGAPFVHCHGSWQAEGGPVEMGHLLCPDSRAAAEIAVQGIGLTGGAFVSREDAETCFRLFAAEPMGMSPPRPRALAVTLKPNTDVPTALAAICREAGWRRARIRGIGSLNGAVFDDAPPMHSFASEFLVLDGRYDAPQEAGEGNAEEVGAARLRIAIVDVDGAIFEGWLVPGECPVCVTCEFVLTEEDGAPPVGQGATT